MKRIPKDVDDLMWELAESNNESAIDEFVSRYPAHASEIHKRLQMLSGLVGAKKGASSSPSIPQFTPRQLQSPTPVRRWVPVTVGVLLAFIAYGSYRLASQMITDRSKPHYFVTTESSKLTESHDNITVPQPEPPSFEPKNNTIAPPEIKSFDKPISIRIDRAPLIAVIDMVAQQSGMIVELAPGLENPEIKMDYQSVSGRRIIADLGKQFGFTALEEGEGKLLLVPAVDPKKQSETGDPLGIAQVVENDASSTSSKN